MLRTATFLTATLALSLLLASAGAAAEPALRLTIDTETAGVEQPFEAFDTDKMNAWDFNGDGVLELVSQNDNNHLYVLDARSGKALAEIRLDLPESWSVREVGGVAIGDVDADGRVDLVSANSMGVIARYEFQPEKSDPDRFEFELVWSKFYSPEEIEPDFYEKRPWAKRVSGFDSAPVLADVTGDGKLEIFFQSDSGPGHVSYDADGNLRWGHVWDDGNTNPWVADLDGDGKYEAVFVTDAGRVWCYDADTGKLKWRFEAREHGAKPGSISIAPLVEDVTGDGNLEISFGARVAVEDPNDPEWYLKQHAMHFTLDHDGNLVWARNYTFGNPMVSMHPLPLDVTGDGVPEILFLDWNTIGHKPGEWQSTGPANMFAVDGETGDVVWHVETKTYYSNKDLVAADVDGDGEQEIVVNAGNRRDGFSVYSLQGEEEEWWPVGEWAVSNDGFVADLYGDGGMQLVVPVAHSRDEPNYRELDVGYREGALKIFDLGVPYDAAWNGMFLFNTHLDTLYGGEGAEMPRGDLRVNASAPDSDAFNLTVTGVPEGATVKARVNDGEWVDLSPAGADHWTGSLDPGDGDVVEVLVRTGDGLRFANASLVWGNVDAGFSPGDVKDLIPAPSGLVAALLAVLLAGARGRRKGA